MKNKTNLEHYWQKRRTNNNFSHHLNKFENHKYIIPNFFDNLQKLKMNDNINYKGKKANVNCSLIIPELIMKSLITSMNKNTNLSLNSLNSINYIYQTYNKGINIIQKRKNRNKSISVENCLTQRKFITNYNPNFSMYSTIIMDAGNNKEFENYKNGNSEELLNSNESYYKKENCSNFILPNKVFLKKNFSMKNIDSNNNNLIKKSKNNTKFKIVNKKDIKYILKGRKFSPIQNREKNENEKNKEKYKLLNKKNYDSTIVNFALLPLKDVLTNFKKIEKNSHSINIRSAKSSIIRKNKNTNEKDNPQSIKIFTEKYEKEKENFNNILFDECIELRKKKFKLESFIKRFANKHFVEKLYKAKEYSLKKCYNK